jgi:hypothetical protein
MVTTPFDHTTRGFMYLFTIVDLIMRTGAAHTLSRIYQTIAQQATETLQWPASDGFLKSLDLVVVEEDAAPPHYLPTGIPDGQGPFGIVAVIDDNHSNLSAVPLVTELLQVFRYFVKNSITSFVVVVLASQ